MGNSEDEVAPKSEKASSPVQEQPSMPSYMDWTAFQAYYGPGVGIPPHYFGSAVASGHTPPPYMWPPQPMMPPYGTAYAAFYPHGGVYAHPSVSLGSHSHGHGITSTATTSEAMTPLSIDTPAKSGSKDRGLMKKLKGFDGLAVSIGSGNVENTQEGARHSNSEDNGTEGSSDGSDGTTSQEGNHLPRKRTSDDMTSTGKDGKSDAQGPVAHGGEVNASIKPLGASMAFPIVGKPVGNIPTPSMTTGTEFKGPTTTKPAALVPTTHIVGPVRDGLSSELWIQDERELKRERRKQSNRESARRSRLRKQAESEELGMKVESLNAENTALRAELNRLKENSEKLRFENSNLMEKLRNTKQERGGDRVRDKGDSEAAPPKATENFLSRVNSSTASNRNSQRESGSHEASGKLHQLLESNPRADAMAAG